jgi:hypothetical protein
LRDRAALAAIEDAAEAALGRKIKVVAAFGGDDAVDGPAPTGPEATPPPAPEPDNAAQHQRDELWRRAEAEPLVQQFVDALRGNLTDVEEN